MSFSCIHSPVLTDYCFYCTVKNRWTLSIISNQFHFLKNRHWGFFHIYDELPCHFIYVHVFIPVLKIVLQTNTYYSVNLIIRFLLYSCINVLDLAPNSQKKTLVKS